MRVGDRIRVTKGTSRASLATLCLPPTANSYDAKRAYRDLVRQLHPDTSGGNEVGDQLSAVMAAFKELKRSGWLDEHLDESNRRSGQLLDVRV